MSADDRQEAGHHYKTLGIEPWAVIESNGVAAYLALNEEFLRAFDQWRAT